MDIPCPEWLTHVEQKWTQLGSATRERFSHFTDIDDLFHFGQSQLQPEDLEALSRICKKYPVKKSSVFAARFREQGNVSFKEQDYTSAVLYYTQGVCHAEKNTEQLSLCYGNRSAALFHLGLYTKCLEDIQQALDEGYPSSLQCKLMDRQTRCARMVKMQEQLKASASKHQTPQTTENTSSNTKMSSAVSVHFTPDKGRYLLVTEEKSAGEIVFEDKAFSFVLIPDNRQFKESGKASIFATEHRHCHHCLCENFNSVPCRGCSYAQYCGQRCEAEAWKQYHCWECSFGSELLALGLFAHLAMRVTLKAGIKEIQRARESCFNLAYEVPSSDGKSDNGKPCSIDVETSDSLCMVSEGNVGGPLVYSQGSNHSSCYHGKSYLGIYSLLPHVKKHDPNLRFLLAFTMAALIQRLSPAVPPCCGQEEGGVSWVSEKTLLGATALRHMLQLQCNAQAVTAIKVEDYHTGSTQYVSDWECYKGAPQGTVLEPFLFTAYIADFHFNSGTCHLQKFSEDASIVGCITRDNEEEYRDDTSLPVQSSKEFRIATAMFPILSLLNHSCQPNTSISFSLGVSLSDSISPLYFASGVRVTVRACRDIAAGQELLHCYGPHYSRMDVEKRQCLLLRQYFFHCQCEACKLELADGSRALPLTFNGLKCEKCGSFLKMNVDMHVCSQLSCDHHILNTELQRKMEILQHHLEQAVELMENNQINGALGILQKAAILADRILLKMHPLQGELADAMARAYATMGLWRQAASHLKCSTAAVSFQYGKDSIELGRQQFKLAQLHFNGGDAASALTVIPLARRLLSLHCDPQCQELQELQAMEACLCSTV